MRFILAILIVLFSTNCSAFWTKGTDTAPEVQTFCKRVLDDGGTVIDVEYMDKTVKLLKQLGIWGNVKFLGDANFGVKLNGSGVTKFYDLSGNNNDATQGTVASQPVWTANVQNGKYGMVFDGGNDYLTMANNTILNFTTGSLTIGTVFKTADNTRQFLYQKQNILAPLSAYWSDLNGSGDRKIFAVSDGTNAVYPVTATNYYDNKGHISIDVANRATQLGKIFVDTVEKDSQDITAVGSVSNDGKYLIGNRSDFDLAFGGSIINNFVFNIALTTAQRTAIETYLNSYFSIY